MTCHRDARKPARILRHRSANSRNRANRQLGTLFSGREAHFGPQTNRRTDSRLTARNSVGRGRSKPMGARLASFGHGNCVNLRDYENRLGCSQAAGRAILRAQCAICRKVAKTVYRLRIPLGSPRVLRGETDAGGRRWRNTQSRGRLQSLSHCNR